MSSPSPQASTPQTSTSQTLTAGAPPTLLPGPMVHAFVCDIKEQPATWNEEKGQPLFTLLKESKNKACIIFTTMKEFNTNISAEQLKDSKLNLGQLEKLHLERQQKLQEWFPQTPAVFWSDTCVEHNGFFGSHISTSPKSSSVDQTANSAAADHQKVVSTYFRLIVKTLLSAKAQDQDFASTTSNAASYCWDEMSFLSSSFDTKSLLLCFDVPANSITSLYQTLPKASDQTMGPLALHIPVLEELVRLYDLSVWAMAKKVRGIEKRRLFESGRRTSTISSLSPNSDPPPNEARTFENFEYLFEISRHLAHSVETTQIAAEVVERLKDTCESLRIFVKNDSTILLTRVQRLSFLHSLLRGLSARAISNEKRLTSEQVLLSNTISQRDSKVNKEMSNFSSQIALATREDGAAMKTIAVVTLTFLPATFVTALLGMNFFTVDSNVPGGQLTSTKDVWIFFVIAVPLTTIVLCFWWWWQRREAERARNHNGSRSEKDIERSGDSSS